MRGQEAGRHEDGTRNVASGDVHGTVVQAGTVPGGIHIHTGPPGPPGPDPAGDGRQGGSQGGSQSRAEGAPPGRGRDGRDEWGRDRPDGPPVPWQLPPGGAFTNRVTELADLERRRARAAEAGHGVLATVSGLGGVGKTAVALTWLHGLRPEFPDGQLYADLGGQGPAGPADPGELLSRFLRALGVPGERLPPALEERGALYRSLTAERRLVVLLDDAATAAQVRHLVPGGRNVTAVTSRQRLPGLSVDGGHAVRLGPLAEDAAVELLAVTLADERVAHQPEDARTLVNLCAGLPLAVRVAGARLAVRPERRLTTMVRALTAERDRLEVLAIEGDHSVRAALDLSYQGLPESAARLYRLLGLHPGPDFGTGVARAVMGGGPGAEHPAPSDESVLVLLDALHDASLLAEGRTHTSGERGEEAERHRFHDLVRLHAAACALEDEPEAERFAALRRIIDHYLVSATRAEELVDPQHRTLARDYGPGSGPVVAADVGAGPDAALDWLERELPNLMAVLRRARTAGIRTAVWQLADAMWPLFLRRKHWEQWRASHVEGLEAARELDDTVAQCRMLTSGGIGELDQGAPARALAMFERAAALFEAEGDALGLARTLNYRGLACGRLDRPDEAAALFARAAAALPGAGDPRAAGLARLNLADLHLARGGPEEAAGEAAAARAALAEADDPYNEARAAVTQGRAHLALEGLQEAEERLTSGLGVLRGMGAAYEAARALEALGELAERLGAPGLARERYEQALACHASLGPTGPGTAGAAGAAGRDSPEAATVRSRLARLDRAADGPDEDEGA